MWRKKQHQDHFFIKAKKMNYRSRSAFKLLEIFDKFKLIQSHHNVIDLGAAPGGFLQVIKQYTKGIVFGVDLQVIQPITGVSLYKTDVRDFNTNMHFHGVISDMAPNISGIKAVDQENILMLNNLAYQFACKHQCNWFVCKSFNHPQLFKWLETLPQQFSLYKPAATVKSSSEIYCIATKFL